MLLAEARPAYELPVKPAQPARTVAPQAAPTSRVRTKTKASPRSRYIVIWALTVCMAIGLASRFAVAASMSVKINQMNKSLAAARAENEQLQLENSELKSLARIEQVAITKLGMIRPAEARTVVNGAAPVNTVVASAAQDASSGKAGGGLFSAVQKWFARIIQTGRAQAKGL